METFGGAAAAADCSSKERGFCPIQLYKALGRNSLLGHVHSTCMNSFFYLLDGKELRNLMLLLERDS